MDDIVGFLCRRVEDLLESNKFDPEHRILIGLAGSPGSGKSTISAALVKLMASRKLPGVLVLPMDGFHLSRAELSGMPYPDEAFRRRGAPFTFDAGAFVSLIRQLRKSSVTRIDEPSLAIRAPSFDHATKDPITEDIYIPSSERIIIIEGNYLFLNQSPWSEIPQMMDETWFVSVDRETAKRRLVARHLQAGIETLYEAAALRAEDNDLVNGDLIRANLIKPDVIVESVDVIGYK